MTAPRFKNAADSERARRWAYSPITTKQVEVFRDGNFAKLWGAFAYADMLWMSGSEPLHETAGEAYAYGIKVQDSIRASSPASGHAGGAA